MGFATELAIASVELEHDNVQEVLRYRCRGCALPMPDAPKVVEKRHCGASFNRRA